MTAKPSKGRMSATGHSSAASTEEQEPLQPLRDHDRRLAVMRAASSLDLKATRLWKDLASRSDQTEPDGVDAVPEGLFSTANNRFVAVATGYVVLNFIEEGKKIRLTDSFPMTLRGHFQKDGTAKVDDVDANTAPVAV